MSIKIIKNKKTGVEYPVTHDDWQVIVSKGFSDRFSLVREEKTESKMSRFVPPEIANTKTETEKKKKANKK